MKAPQTVLFSLSCDELEALVRAAVRSELASHSNERDVLTTAQVADLLGTHPDMVRRYARHRGLPFSKIGSTYRFTRADVLEWVKKQGG